MPRQTHAQYVEALRLKLEQAQQKSEERKQTEKQKLIDKRTALVDTKKAKTEILQTKIMALNEANIEVQAKLDAKIAEIEEQLGELEVDELTEAAAQ